MIIDCHGHYTTAPKELEAFRQKQIAELKEPSSARSKGTISISDDQIRNPSRTPAEAPARARHGRHDLLSPAAGMGHHIGDATTSLHWSQECATT
jgi:4-oxalmesaconate hydratase